MSAVFSHEEFPATLAGAGDHGFVATVNNITPDDLEIFMRRCLIGAETPLDIEIRESIRNDVGKIPSVNIVALCDALCKVFVVAQSSGAKRAELPLRAFVTLNNWVAGGDQHPGANKFMHLEHVTDETGFSSELANCIALMLSDAQSTATIDATTAVHMLSGRPARATTIIVYDRNTQWAPLWFAAGMGVLPLSRRAATSARRFLQWFVPYIRACLDPKALTDEMWELCIANSLNKFNMVRLAYPDGSSGIRHFAPSPFTDLTTNEIVFLNHLLRNPNLTHMKDYKPMDYLVSPRRLQGTFMTRVTAYLLRSKFFAGYRAPDSDTPMHQLLRRITANVVSNGGGLTLFHNSPALFLYPFKAEDIEKVCIITWTGGVFQFTFHDPSADWDLSFRVINLLIAYFRHHLNITVNGVNVFALHGNNAHNLVSNGDFALGRFSAIPINPLMSFALSRSLHNMVIICSAPVNQAIPVNCNTREVVRGVLKGTSFEVLQDWIRQKLAALMQGKK